MCFPTAALSHDARIVYAWFCWKLLRMHVHTSVSSGLTLRFLLVAECNWSLNATAVTTITRTDVINLLVTDVRVNLSSIPLACKALLVSVIDGIRSSEIWAHAPPWSDLERVKAGRYDLAESRLQAFVTNQTPMRLTWRDPLSAFVGSADNENPHERAHEGV